MSTQRFAVEFDHQVVGVAVRVPGGFMFISSDRRFEKWDGEVFPRARGLVRRLGQRSDTGRRTDRGGESSNKFAPLSIPRQPKGRFPTSADNLAGAAS